MWWSTHPALAVVFLHKLAVVVVIKGWITFHAFLLAQLVVLSFSTVHCSINDLRENRKPFSAPKLELQRPNVSSSRQVGGHNLARFGVIHASDKDVRPRTDPTFNLGSDDDDDDDEDVLKNIRIVVDHPDCLNDLSIINMAHICCGGL